MEENGRRLVDALEALGFSLSKVRKDEILRGKDFVEIKDGPFDIDLIFAPDGIESFQEAWDRRAEIEGFSVCSIDGIIASKKAANRLKDRESLDRLQEFSEFFKKNQKR